MKIAVIAALVWVIGLSWAIAAPTPLDETRTAPPRVCAGTSTVNLLLQFLAPSDPRNQTTWQDARRGNQGCCSHHRGVCGCAPNGNLQCCDGSASPSCGC